MKFILVMLLTFGVVSVACSTSPTPTLTPTAGIATPSAPTVTTVAQPTATATPAQVPTPTPRPTAVPTLEPTTTPASTLTLEPTAIPTLEPTSHPTSALEASIHTVQIEFPPWVETSPDIAQSIVLSAVIAKARFLSIEPIIREHSTWGYVVEMVYRFQVFQYLKGEGSDELVIHLSSGPKYIAFPDWLAWRGEREARELAEKWLDASLAMYDNQRDGILLLRTLGQEQRYSFTSIDRSTGHSGCPMIGKTWLPENKDSMYRIEFTSRKSATIFLSELNVLIDNLRPLMEGQYAVCVPLVLNHVNRVRSQLLGTHKQLTLAGSRDPKPFPRQVLTFDSQLQANTEVFRFTRPPHQSPRFRHHWLEGKDKALFAIDLHADADGSYESLRTIQTLPIGEYRVHFSKHERPLPCSETPDPDDWPVQETVELVLNVRGPLGVDGG